MFAPSNGRFALSRVKSAAQGGHWSLEPPFLLTRSVWTAVSLGACGKLPGPLNQSKKHASELATAL